jgi:DnaJ-class molecular chaperone
VRAPADDDHYRVLGVARAAGTAEIRRAYRLLALRHHPDRAGPHATELFQRITLAYHVLSNPGRRASYDARAHVHAHAPGRAGAGAGGAPTPAADAAAAARAAVFARRQPAPGPFIERLTATLDALLATAAARLAEGGLVELLLTASEAREGGTVAITLPWEVPCPTCGGCAVPGNVWCVRCEFAGTVREEVTACITIPPFVTDGATFSVAVDPGEEARPLRIRVRV